MKSILISNLTQKENLTFSIIFVSSKNYEKKFVFVVCFFSLFFSWRRFSKKIKRERGERERIERGRRNIWRMDFGSIPFEWIQLHNQRIEQFLCSLVFFSFSCYQNMKEGMTTGGCLAILGSMFLLLMMVMFRFWFYLSVFFIVVV